MQIFILPSWTRTVDEKQLQKMGEKNWSKMIFHSRFNLIAHYERLKIAVGAHLEPGRAQTEGAIINLSRL